MQISAEMIQVDEDDIEIKAARSVDGAEPESAVRGLQQGYNGSGILWTWSLSDYTAIATFGHESAARTLFHLLARGDTDSYYNAVGRAMLEKVVIIFALGTLGSKDAFQKASMNHLAEIEDAMRVHGDKIGVDLVLKVFWMHWEKDDRPKGAMMGVLRSQLVVFMEESMDVV